MLGSIFAVVVACCASPVLPDTVTYSNSKFVNEAGQVFVVGAQPMINGPDAGTLNSDFAFNAHDINPQTGLYRTPTLAVLWRITASSGGAGGAAGGWQGANGSLADVELTTFDQVTGHGTATAHLPIARAERAGLRYAGFTQDGQSTIETVLGVSGLLALDSSGAPVNAEWSGQLSVSTTWPNLWIEINEPFARLGQIAYATVLMRQPVNAPTSFTVESTVQGIVSPWTQTINLDTGVYAYNFGYEIRATGRYQFKVTNTATGAQYLSPKVMALVDSYGVEMLHALGGDVPAHGATHDDPAGDPPDDEGMKRCNHFTVYGNSDYSKCTACAHPAPQIDCPDSILLFYSMTCTYQFFAVCVTTDGGMPITTQTPLSQYVKVSGPTQYQCGVDHGAGASAKISTQAGGPGGSVTIETEVHTGSTDHFLFQRCCEYQRSDTLPPVPVFIRDCRP